MTRLAGSGDISHDRPADGYITDVTYSPTFTREVLPAWLDFTATLCGIPPPTPSGTMRWCELGCGMGITAVVAAAAHPDAEFHAIDLMPTHIVHARGLAQSAGVTNLTLHCASFEDPALGTLGSFDYIVAHGVYSWIEPQVRDTLRTFIDRHLAPGGLAFVSYNAMPGWAPDLPLQRLLREIAAVRNGDSNQRFTAAADLAAEMSEAGARALLESPMARAGLEEFRQKTNAAYFPHEYLPAGWEPRYVTDVRRELAAIGLAPVGSAIIGNNFDTYTIGRRGRAALAKVDDPNLRELLRDYFRATTFRRDVFSRAAMPSDDVDRRRLLAHTTFQLAMPEALVSYRMQTSAGTVAFDTPAAHHIVSSLSRRTSTLDDLDANRFLRSDLLANALALCAAQRILPVSRDAVDVARINEAFASTPDGAGMFPYRMFPHGTALLIEPLDSAAIDGDNVDPGSGGHAAAWWSFLREHGVARNGGP